MTNEEYKKELTRYWDSIRDKGISLTIPENPTNGDMIKAMFPNINIEEGSKYVLLKSECDNVAIWNSWWNAPYKKGEEIE